MGYSFHQPGVPVISVESCTACGRCARICPTETLVVEQGKIRMANGSFMGCIGCGHCMMVCPNGSIRVSGRRIAPEDLVELPQKEQLATADQLDGLLVARRSVRRFADQEVNRAAVDRILAMTSTAPMGIPPSEVGIVVFHGRAKVEQFTADAVASFRRVLRMTRPLILALMRPVLGRVQYEMMRDFVRPLLEGIIREWENGRDAFAYGAPLALLFHYGPTADQTDADIAATYAMLAAESLGLGSCMLGTSIAFARDCDFKEKYGIPKENKTGITLVIGHPTQPFQRGIRRQMASIRFA